MAATLSRPVAEAADEPRTIYIALPQVQTRRGYLVFKRCFDFTFALLALIVLAVPMGIIAAIIALDSPGGPIYRQERLGKDGKPFLICKFRSMRMDAEKDGPKWAERSDDRCTRFGALLRKTRLDELPQLWNILRGDMSVIGPRPALWNQEDLLAERDKYGANDVKPGLSGWAQICGRDELEISDKARLDGEYVQRMSFGFDCRCFFGTAISALSGDGVVEGGTGELHRMENKK
mgnify:CR=1 FL=1